MDVDDEEQRSLSEHSAGEEEDELMKDDVDDAEQLLFDFEAFALCDGDKTGIVDMLTQIFLRADVDVEDMASALIGQSPFGCVFRPAEDFIDEDNENIVFGIVSVLELSNSKKFENDIWNLLKARAKKYAQSKCIVSRLEKLSSGEEGKRVGLFINERMLHFPSSIAAPAFGCLKGEIAASGTRYRFDVIIMVQKIRIADVGQGVSTKQVSGQDSHDNVKRKKGKAAKKSSAAAAVASANVVFDNPEEELLFSAHSSECDDDGVLYFQYPVQSDVEKESKFNSMIIKGTTYRPYRRVCLMDPEKFDRFLDLVNDQDK
ncbi:unnamed protein product [Toxocara canis]|uniref:Protein BCCIP-like protein n=1 Tax=Toxocara canis TaxID=6265 RepID=A0A183TYL2_TOXCA|nr:unnamed protein product [Toxocara canis]